MSQKILLITPPFTQLNTPYPATAYLKGFLATQQIESFQVDLGLDVLLEVFSTKGLRNMFSMVQYDTIQSENSKLIYCNRELYIQQIDDVIQFLQGRNLHVMYRLTQPDFLPQASRFQYVHDLHWAFGQNGLHDKAKHLATLFIEDIADFITHEIDSNFGFSRYAERLARCAYEFDELYAQLHMPPTYIDTITLDQLDKIICREKPTVAAFSMPFPGNVYSAFRCMQFIKANYPSMRIIMGGGFVNTELRSLQDKRVFEYTDAISFDDGELPLLHWLDFIDGNRPAALLKRTMMLEDEQVQYYNGSIQRDFTQAEIGTPTYTDLHLDRYLQVIEVNNPMQRLWSDGRWNKLTMAHGCYWGKCTFCDVSLDYIKNYHATSVQQICDRMETLIAETGINGFHFVDEAAPPAMMRDLALEIIHRKLQVSWWANIRFEKSFTDDICFLLKESGCIAVSGGLEVAADRLLAIIEKGVSVAQVTQVLYNFSKHHIMVHAYLMYGYPTQTAQETVDALEVVRQLFDQGILQSAFWHRFALTVHSPIGQNPEKYGITIVSKQGAFANNDAMYIEKNGIQHEQFTEGLKRSLFNYMQHMGLDKPLHFWFEHKIPNTSVPSNYIEQLLANLPAKKIQAHTKVLWLGKLIEVKYYTKNKKGRSFEMADLFFASRSKIISLTISNIQGRWLSNILSEPHLQQPILYQDLQQSYEKLGIDDDFELFWFNKILPLQVVGLLHV